LSQLNTYDIYEYNVGRVDIGVTAYSDRQAVRHFVMQGNRGSAKNYYAEITSPKKEKLVKTKETFLQTGECSNCRYIDPANAPVCPNCECEKDLV